MSNDVICTQRPPYPTIAIKVRTVILLFLMAGLSLAASKPKTQTFQADVPTVWSAVKAAAVRDYSLLNRDEELKTLTVEYSEHGDLYKLGITVSKAGNGSEVSIHFTEMFDASYTWGRKGRIAKKFFADVSAQLSKPQ